MMEFPYLSGIEMVVPSYSKSVTVLRKPEGTYDEHGRWQQQEPQSFPIQGSVQIAKPEDLVDVEEGRRTGGAIKVYTDRELRTASVEDGTQPDIIQWNNKRYLVEQVSNWDELGGYFKVIALKMGQ